MKRMVEIVRKRQGLSLSKINWRVYFKAQVMIRQVINSSQFCSSKTLVMKDTNVMLTGYLAAGKLLKYRVPRIRLLKINWIYSSWIAI